MSLKSLPEHKYSRISNACAELAKEAISSGISAEEIKQLLAEIWHDECVDQGKQARKVLQG